MKNENSYPYDLVIVADTTDEDATAQVEAATKQRAANLLKLWRSHFPNTDEPVNKDYTPSNGTSLSLVSTSPTRLTATRTTTQKKTVYEFDAETDGLIASHTDTSTGETTVHADHIANYIELARVVFACYEIEADSQDS